jgi:hypothetical protein
VSELADDDGHEHGDDGHDHDHRFDHGQSDGQLDAMLDAIRQATVAQLILSTVSTLASVAYGKLEMKDAAEAKKAIDAIDVLLPLLEGEVDVGIKKEFEQAVTGLKLAYADAVSPAE